MCVFEIPIHRMDVPFACINALHELYLRIRCTTSGIYIYTYTYFVITTDLPNAIFKKMPGR